MGRELWVTDGTPDGTEPVVDLGIGDSDPAHLVAVGNHLFFAATTNDFGRELYVVNPDLPAGDYDINGVVDGADFLAWRRNLAHTVTPAGGGVAGDLNVWRDEFGEASSLAVTAANSLFGFAEQSSEFQRNSPAYTSLSDLGSAVAETRIPVAEKPDDDVADAVFAAGDFTRLFAARRERYPPPLLPTPPTSISRYSSPSSNDSASIRR